MLKDINTTEQGIFLYSLLLLLGDDKMIEFILGFVLGLIIRFGGRSLKRWRDRK